MENFKYVELSLSDSPYYTYSVSLEDQSYQLRFTYNETMKLYTLSLYDAALNLLVGGVGLVPNYPIMKDYIITGLTGAFLMVPVGDVDMEYYKLYPDQIHKYYRLYYIYVDSTD